MGGSNGLILTMGTVHVKLTPTMWLLRRRGHITFGTCHGFDLDKDLEEQQEKCEFWEKNGGFP